jgi:prevent-host-death family protein
MTITETRKKITSLENTMNYDDTISITNENKLVDFDTFKR